ncbi:hypothetical protein [Desulfolithobacter sp.]
MSKKIQTVMAAVAMVALAGTSVLAATGKCTVTEIKENVVVLDCGKKAAKFKVNDKVKIKTIKKKAIEGC